jgi:hypothetical protein
MYGGQLELAERRAPFVGNLGRRKGVESGLRKLEYFAEKLEFDG